MDTMFRLFRSVIGDISLVIGSDSEQGLCNALWDVFETSIFLLCKRYDNLIELVTHPNHKLLLINNTFLPQAFKTKSPIKL